MHEGRATKKSNVEAVSGLYANLDFGDDCSEERHCIGGSFVFQNRGFGGGFVQLRREHHMLNRWMGGALDKLHLAYLRAFPASYAGV